jgi:hypothetical protein
MNNGLYKYAGNYNVEHWTSTGSWMYAFYTNGIRYNYDDVYKKDKPSPKTGSYTDYSIKF